MAESPSENHIHDVWEDIDLNEPIEEELKETLSNASEHADGPRPEHVSKQHPIISKLSKLQIPEKVDTTQPEPSSKFEMPETNTSTPPPLPQSLPNEAPPVGGRGFLPYTPPPPPSENPLPEIILEDNHTISSSQGRAFKTDLENALEKIVFLEEDCRSLRKDLDFSKDESAHLRQNMSGIEIDRDVAQKRLIEAEQELKDTLKKNSMLQDEVNKLQSKLALLHRELAGSKNQTQIAPKEIAESGNSEPAPTSDPGKESNLPKINRNLFNR